MKLSIITRKTDEKLDMIIARSLWKASTVSKISGIRKWWCYNFSVGGYGAESNHDEYHSAVINYKYFCCSILADDFELVLYEEIQLSPRFPQGFNYEEREIKEVKNKFKVWNLEKCMKKLEIDLESVETDISN